MNKRIINIIFILIVGMVGGIFSSQVLTPRFLEEDIFDSNYLAKIVSGPVYLTEKKDITVQENTALQYSIEKVEDSIVGIEAITGNQATYGSGLILTTDGLMVTLAEFFEPGKNTKVFIGKESSKYQVLKKNKEVNLALIKIENSNLKPCGFANFSELKIGERVFLLGKVFLQEDILTLANQGIVKYFTKDFIRTNIFEKNSLAGSSLFNIKGDLLGLNTIDSEGKVTAIPINVIRDFAGF